VVQLGKSRSAGKTPPSTPSLTAPARTACIRCGRPRTCPIGVSEEPSCWATQPTPSRRRAALGQTRRWKMPWYLVCCCQTSCRPPLRAATTPRATLPTWPAKPSMRSALLVLPPYEIVRVTCISPRAESTMLC